MTEFYALPNEGEKLTTCLTYLVRGAACGIRVPSWVPPELIPEYVDCAKEYGSDHAVKHIDKIMEDLGYE